MISMPLETVSVDTERDVSRVRRAITAYADNLSFDLLARTHLVTAASELARNMLAYAGGGSVRIAKLRHEARVGLKATFEDQGPGIENLDEALSDGFSSSLGLGLGLGGARRLVDDFELETAVGEGTTVSIASWHEPDRHPPGGP